MFGSELEADRYRPADNTVLYQTYCHLTHFALSHITHISHMSGNTVFVINSDSPDCKYLDSYMFLFFI